MHLEFPYSHLLKVPFYRQSALKTCVPASLRMILEFHSVAVEEDELCRRLETDSEGTALINLLAISPLSFPPHKQTFRFQEVRPCTLDMVQRQITHQHPVLLILNVKFIPQYAAEIGLPPLGTHAVVVVGVDKHYIYLNDPYVGNAPQRLDKGQAQAVWDDLVMWAIVVDKLPVTRTAGRS